MTKGGTGLKEYHNLMGINYVRPPLLKFDKGKVTKDYTEYKIKTYKDSKKESEKDNDVDRVFTTDIDSLIYCNETITIRQPKPSFMKKKMVQQNSAMHSACFLILRIINHLI